MHFIVIGFIFLISVYQTVRRGPAGAFAYVYLPVLLCISSVRPVSVTGLPDIFSPMAVTYGVLVGMVLSGRLPSFKLHLVDWLVLLCSITVVITGYLNGNFWTLVSSAGTETLRWLVPYYMARLAFRDGELRRHMAIMLCWIAMAIAAMGLIEFRLWPLFFSRLLEVLGSNAHNAIVHPPRMGFFRAMVTCEHPIDLGNTGLILAGLIPAMAVVGGLRLRDWRVLAGTGCAMLIVVESISFTSLMGLGAAIAIFAVLYRIRRSELLLPAGMVAAIIGGVMFTQHLLNVDLEAIKPAAEEAQFSGSYYVRTLIVQNSWNSFGKEAGWFGFSDLGLSKEVLGLDSVDNSYMLFLMRRGWVHLTLRLFMGLVIAYIGMKMLQRLRVPLMRLPVAAIVAALLGTMIAMYTVWFGFVYASLWTVVLGMFVTMRQMIAEGRFAELYAPKLPARRGFEVIPMPPVPMAMPVPRQALR